MSEDEVSKWLNSASKTKEDRKRIYSKFKDLLQELNANDLSTRQKETLSLIKLMIDDDKKQEDSILDAYEIFDEEYFIRDYHIDESVRNALDAANKQFGTHDFIFMWTC